MRIQVTLPDSGTLKFVDFTDKGVEDKRKCYFPALFSVVGYDNRLQITLVPEPDNEIDRFAIRCYAHGIPIGYIAREDACLFQDKLYVINILEKEERIRFYCNFKDFKIIKDANGNRPYRILEYRIKKKS